MVAGRRIRRFGDRDFEMTGMSGFFDTQSRAQFRASQLRRLGHRVRVTPSPMPGGRTGWGVWTETYESMRRHEALQRRGTKGGVV